MLISAVPPLMLKTAPTPAARRWSVRRAARRRASGSLAVLERSEHAVLRLQPAGRKSLRRRARLVLAAGDDGRFPAAYFCIKAFSETDRRRTSKKFDVPTLILHGDDDQIVPIGDSAPALVQARQGRHAQGLQGRPHGMCTTLKDEVNAELLDFIRG